MGFRSQHAFWAVTLVLFGGLWPVAWGYTPRFDAEEQETIAAYETASKAVVTINAVVHGSPSSGAGVVIDPAGIVLTSSHVIGDATQVLVSFEDGRKARGVIIGRMADTADLALLKVNTEKPLSAVKIGDSSQVKVGQKVLAIGNPYGFERTLTLGIISRIDKSRNRLQTDAAINPGNSGGPLLDNQGYLIGINQSIYNPDGNRSNIGIGFAVPVNSAKTFLKRLATQQAMPSQVAALSQSPIIRYNPTSKTGYENVSILLQRFTKEQGF